jgi:hypothetical protein
MLQNGQAVQPPKYNLILSKPITYFDLLFIAWPLTGSNLQMLYINVYETVLNIASATVVICVCKFLDIKILESEVYF